MRDYVISIDMGGTKVLAALINSKDGIRVKIKKATKSKNGNTNFVKLLWGIVNEVILEAGISEKNVKAICLGIPGSVDPISGRIGIAPNLNIKNLNIKEQLQQYTSIPVLIENDVNLAALGIKHFGIGKEADNMLVVFVGTGIGGGLIFKGNMHRGASFSAGEIGHIVLQPNGPLCGCGKKGCFEAYASRTSVVRDITKQIKAGKRSLLAKLLKEKVPIKSKALSNALKKKDPVTVKVVTNAGVIIGRTLANINNLLNLQLIVLGGGVMEAASDYLTPIIKKSFKEYSLKDAGKTVKIFTAKLGDEAALYGGIALAEEFLGIKV